MAQLYFYGMAIRSAFSAHVSCSARWCSLCSVEVARIGGDIYPANQDPDSRFKDLPPGYFTTKPNTRGQLFYDLPNTDPQVITTDEQTKETITDSEFTTFFSIAGSPLSRYIHAPVLVVVGEEDAMVGS